MVRTLVGKTTEITAGQMKKVSVDGNEIIVINFNGNYFAVDDTCTHAGGSLSEGKLEVSAITCDWHGAQFQCENGKLLKFPAKINDLRSYKVLTESGNIFVET